MRTQLRSFDRLTRAFTMVELMVSVGIVAVASSAALSFFINLQRGLAFSSAWTEVRTNQVRLFDAMGQDFRNSTSITFTNGTSLPATLTIPLRYTSYESTGYLAGDPKRAGSTGNEPTLNTTTGKLSVYTDLMTVTYAVATTSGTKQVVTRTASWSESGTAKTGARSIATFANGVTISFANSSGTAFTSGNDTVVTTIAAISDNRQGNRSTPIVSTMTDRAYLRSSQIKIDNRQ